MCLVDTNIFLEGLLHQDKADDVRVFLKSIDFSTIFMTDLSLHSIGIILFRLGNFELFISFLEDMVVDGIGVLSVEPENLNILDQIIQKFSLDFDDAYQYAVADKYALQLISFDKDFDRTDRKRWEPIEILN